jgi:MFS superfamily sulfate permease-like transporter
MNITTAFLMILSPMIFPYIPTILASLIVCYIGIDLTLEAIWQGARSYQWPEYLVVVGTVFASTILGFAMGLVIGLGIALVIHLGYHAMDSVSSWNLFVLDGI